MFSQHIQRYAFFGVLLFIVISAWSIQANNFINVDVGWLLEATRRMLAGGTYKNDFFENNPPWVLYFYMPPVLFSKYFSMSIIFVMRLYVFSLCIISLAIAYFFLNNIFKKHELNIIRFLLVILAILYLITPMYEFAQREHLLFVLSMPYLLMMVQRLENHKVDTSLAMVVGFFAGSVFILKPYFLMTLFLVESYYLIRKKSLKALVRPEIAVMFVLGLVYLSIIGLYHRDYLAIVMPFAMRYCYFGSRILWVNYLFTQTCVMCYMALLFYFATHGVNRYLQFSRILLLAFFGFYFSYVVQQEDVYYRIIPAYATSLFLFSFLLAMYVSTPIKKNTAVIWVAYFTLILFLYLKRTTYIMEYYPLYHPLFSLCFFTIIFLVILYLSPQFRVVSSVFYLKFIFILFLALGWVFFSTYYLQLFEIEAQVAIFTLVLIYGFLMPGDYKEKLIFSSYIATVSVIVVLPILQFIKIQTMVHKTKPGFEKLINYINKNLTENKSYYFFLTSIHNFLYQNATSASRFSFFWALPGLVKQSYLPMDLKTKQQYLKDKNFFIDMVSEDLNTKKPEWVFVDMLSNKSYLTWNGIYYNTPIHFDYLQYFSHHKSFDEAWKNYHYFTTISAKSYSTLNPYQYSLNLYYRQIPSDSVLQFDVLYLYVNQSGQLEVALLDKSKKIFRFAVHLNEVSDRAIKKVLSTEGVALDNKSRADFFAWMLNQSIECELYHYAIYKRISLKASGKLSNSL